MQHLHKLQYMSFRGMLNDNCSEVLKAAGFEIQDEMMMELRGSGETKTMSIFRRSNMAISSDIPRMLLFPKIRTTIIIGIDDGEQDISTDMWRKKTSLRYYIEDEHLQLIPGKDSSLLLREILMMADKELIISKIEFDDTCSSFNEEDIDLIIQICLKAQERVVIPQASNFQWIMSSSLLFQQKFKIISNPPESSSLLYNIFSMVGIPTVSQYIWLVPENDTKIRNDSWSSFSFLRSPNDDDDSLPSSKRRKCTKAKLLGKTSFLFIL